MKLIDFVGEYRMTSSDPEEPVELVRACCRKAGNRDLRGVAGSEGPEVEVDPFSPKDCSDIESVESSEYLLGRAGQSSVLALFSLSDPEPEVEDLALPAL